MESSYRLNWVILGRSTQGSLRLFVACSLVFSRLGVLSLDSAVSFQSAIGRLIGHYPCPVRRRSLDVAERVDESESAAGPLSGGVWLNLGS